MELIGFEFGPIICRKYTSIRIGVLRRLTVDPLPSQYPLLSDFLIPLYPRLFNPSVCLHPRRFQDQREVKSLENWRFTNLPFFNFFVIHMISAVIYVWDPSSHPLCHGSEQNRSTKKGLQCKDSNLELSNNLAAPQRKLSLYSTHCRFQ